MRAMPHGMICTMSRSRRTTLLLIATMLASVVVVPFVDRLAEAQSSPLVVTPESGTLRLGTSDTVQFTARFNGQDVTGQAQWNSGGLTSEEARRVRLLGPGLFGVGDRWGGALISVSYQGYHVDKPVTVTGMIIYEQLILNLSKGNLKKGESVAADLRYQEGKVCPTSDCQSRIDGVATAATWSISDPKVLSMTSPGTFKAIADSGSAVVTATYKGITQSATIIVTAADTGQYDVSLTSPEPVFGSRQVQMSHHQNYSMFNGVVSMKGTDGGRYFVVAGNCSMVNSNWGGGGMYLFTDDGKYLSKRDACLDATAGRKPRVCKHDTGCHAYPEMVDIGSGALVRELGFVISRERPWITYKVSKTGIDMIDRLFVARQGDPGGGWPDEEGDIYGAANMAYSNGVLIDGETVYEGKETYVSNKLSFDRDKKGDTNKVYAIPKIREIAEFRTDGPFPCLDPAGACSGAPPLYKNKYRPIVGVGEYFLATEDLYFSAASRGKVLVYRMPSATALLAGEEPKLVQTIEGFGQVAAYSLDVLDPKRIVVIFADDPTRGGPYRGRIYKAGSNGLVLEKEISGLESMYVRMTGPTSNVSLAGEYFAYTKCAGGSDLTPTFWHYGQIIRVCELVVTKNGNKLNVQPIPKNQYGESQLIQGVGISPNGTIMVGTQDFLATDVASEFAPLRYAQYIYLYKLRAATTGSTGGTTATTTQRSATFRERYSTGERNAISSYLDRLTALLERLGVSLPPQGR